MRNVFAGLLCLMALGVATPPPSVQRPPDGTYRYEVTSAGTVVYDSTIIFASTPQGFVESERATVQGKTVTSDTMFDMRTMRPLRHLINVLDAGKTQVTQLNFGNASTTLVAPPMRFEAVAGTTLMAPEEGLAEFWALAPLYAKIADFKPFSVVALNGAHVFEAVPSAGSDPRPTDAPEGDIELTVLLKHTTMTVWYDPKTLVVDRADLGGAVMRLTGTTPGAAMLPVLKTPGPAATAPPLARAHYAEKPIAFTSDEATLRGVLDVPRAAGKVAAIVFVHGSGAGTRDGGTPQNPTFKYLANSLSNAGIAVLRYDKRGIGQSTGTPTEDWHMLGADLKAAVEFLRTQPGIDPKRIFVLGHSEGGFIVPKFANELGVRGVVIMAGPALPMEQIIDYQLKGATAEEKAPYLKGLASYIGIEPTTIISSVRVPVLLLQGGKDAQIRLSEFPRLVSAAKKANREVTVRIFPEDDHLFIKLPATQKMQEAELLEPHALDPRVGSTIVTWIAKLGAHTAP